MKSAGKKYGCGTDSPVLILRMPLDALGGAALRTSKLVKSLLPESSIRTHELPPELIPR
jgi:hypothetical protein